MRIKASILDGQLMIPNTPANARKLAEHEGKFVELTIETWRDTRSANQNRYYWGVVIAYAQRIFKDLWGEDMDADSAHEVLKQMFNSRIVIDKSTGEQIRIGGSSAALNTKQFEQYISKISSWAYHQCGVAIPPPEER